MSCCQGSPVANTNANQEFEVNGILACGGAPLGHCCVSPLVIVVNGSKQSVTLTADKTTTSLLAGQGSAISNVTACSSDSVAAASGSTVCYISLALSTDLSAAWHYPLLWSPSRGYHLGKPLGNPNPNPNVRLRAQRPYLLPGQTPECKCRTWPLSNILVPILVEDGEAPNVSSAAVPTSLLAALSPGSIAP